MKPTALGLTCRDAFTVFSENQSLKLQKEKDELKSRYKPTPRVFETFDEYEEIYTSAVNTLHSWIQENLESHFIRGGRFHRAIYEAIHMITKCDSYAHETATKLLRLVSHVLSVIHYIDSSGDARFSDNKRLKADTVCWIFFNEFDGEFENCVTDAVEYPLQEEFDKYFMDTSACSPEGGSDAFVFQQMYDED